MKEEIKIPPSNLRYKPRFGRGDILPYRGVIFMRLISEIYRVSTEFQRGVRIW